MGSHDAMDLHEEDPPGWWWQVLSGWSRAPVIGSGGADRELSARGLVEAQLYACDGALLGMIVGPRGQVVRCLKTIGGGHRWLPGE